MISPGFTGFTGFTGFPALTRHAPRIHQRPGQHSHCSSRFSFWFLGSRFLESCFWGNTALLPVVFIEKELFFGYHCLLDSFLLSF